MGVIALPVIFGFLFTIADGIRRMIAESELARQMKQIDERHDEAINEIDRVYREKMPSLIEDVTLAKQEMDRSEATFRILQSRQTAPKEAA